MAIGRTQSRMRDAAGTRGEASRSGGGRQKRDEVTRRALLSRLAIGGAVAVLGPVVWATPRVRAAQAKVTLRFSHEQPKGSIRDQMAVLFARRVSEYSQGE